MRSRKQIQAEQALKVLGSLTEPRTRREIANTIKTDFSVVSLVVKYFGERGCVERRFRVSDWDKHAVEFLLTQKGQKALAHYKALSELLNGGT